MILLNAKGTEPELTGSMPKKNCFVSDL